MSLGSDIMSQVGAFYHCPVCVLSFDEGLVRDGNGSQRSLLVICLLYLDVDGRILF